MKPFFPFYGSKWRVAKRYPSPRNGVVVEPFAGSAGYCTFYEPARVVLYDADPIIVSVWDYLIRVSASEVLALPDLEVGQSVDDTNLSQESRWLIGFWLNRGSATPKKTKTAFSARVERAQLVWSQRARERIASQVDRIRHWEVAYGSYESTPLLKATWFVDPPYVDKGRYYRFNKIDYDRLGAWCGHLPGQAIVCEQVGASWLPFTPLATVKSTRGTSEEVCWIARGGMGMNRISTVKAIVDSAPVSASEDRSSSPIGEPILDTREDLCACGHSMRLHMNNDRGGPCGHCDCEDFRKP